MNRRLSVLLVSVSLATSSAAQHQFSVTRISGPIRDAGTYHWATGTWRRHAGAQAGNEPKMLFNNNANSGHLGSMGVPLDLVWTDEGRVPSTESEGLTDEYVVEGFRLYYCSSVNGPQNGSVAFYEKLEPCTDILGLSPTASFDLQLPGGGLSMQCWMVTIDLSSSTNEFAIDADADRHYDSDADDDSFGWTLTLEDQGSGGANGPILCGDPNNVPYGDGTYYQNPGASYGTGLGAIDAFWLNDASGAIANGCYWFGGYANGNPFSSFGLEVYGRLGGLNCYLGCYCPTNPNSTGESAEISGSGISASSGTATLYAAPVPDQFGLFFHAINQANVPFGCSYLCATGNIIRGAVITGSGNVATYVYDNSDEKHSLSAYVGATRNFQYWFRDPLNAPQCGGQTFNTSTATSAAIMP